MSADLLANPSPKMIGPYLIGKTLGAGSFGKVKMGTNLETKKKVALKMVQWKSNIKSQTESIEREISMMIRLKHPNIVELIEVLEIPEKRTTVLVLELVTGGTLLDYILEKDELPEPEAAKMFRQIISAIEYSHRNLVIHRDLKAENILLDEEGNVKIADFGLSNLMRIGDFLRTSCGSPHYSCPEVHYQEQYIGPEVDVWAIGVLLYAMVTGSFPWDGYTLEEQIANCKKGKFIEPKGVSEKCVHLIGRMLEVDSKQRATMEEIQQHPWVTEGAASVPNTPTQLTASEIDEEIVAQIASLGFERDQVMRDLTNPLAATSQTVSIYSLFANHKKKGGQVVVQPRRESFRILKVENPAESAPKTEPQSINVEKNRVTEGRSPF
jgi:serine/threonine protein kinase